MIVRTVSFQPKIVAKEVSRAPKPIAKSPPAKKVEKALPQTKPASLTPPKIDSSSCSGIKSSLVQEIKKDLATLEKKTAVVPKVALSLPKELFPTQPKEEIEIPDAGYGEILVSYLQNSLDLPEMGEVKVDLELDPRGQIVRFEILEAKSKKNSDFLKKRLPELALPCFNNDRKSDETVTFTITFKNRPLS